LGQLGLGGKALRVWNAGLPPALTVVGPLRRQIERTVQQRVPQRTGIAQQHTDLAVVDLARRAPGLAGDASRVAALFQKARLIEHQHRLRVPQMLPDVGAQLTTHRLRVPEGPAPQVLNRSGGGVAAACRPLPAGFALGRTQQPPQRGYRPLARLGALDIGGQAALKIVQVRGPSRDHRRLLVNEVRGRSVSQHHDSSR
jgi:hypothetical protein